MKIFFYILFFITFACSCQKDGTIKNIQNKDFVGIENVENDNDTSHTDRFESDTFSFPAYEVKKDSRPIKFWATSYHLVQLDVNTGDIPLRDLEGSELGPRLSLVDWCNSALEGSVQIDFKNGELKTYNYAGSTPNFEVDCSKVVRFKLGKTKFKLARGVYGDGFGEYILAPYRTLAADLDKFKLGTVVYIPRARGAEIKLNNGKTIIHDGYFFIGDKGGAIKSNHLDVFIGTHEDSDFFPWIENNQKGTFIGYEVTDLTIIAELKRLHQP
jgi:3D (Asp-Asp-Asp) domain-containing protein